jgi:Uma2 family endonuclease
MTAAQRLDLVSVEEYLAGELDSPVKHEYLGGMVYAMAGGRNVHNLIAANIQGLLHARLRGRPCTVYNSDTKIRVQWLNQVRFYYPDVPVICEPNPPEDTFHDAPAVLFEVISSGTRRIDEGEKRDAYQSIASLKVYGLVEQELPRVVLYRRGQQGFVREVYTGLDAVLPLSEIGVELQLADIYDRVVFTGETT